MTFQHLQKTQMFCFKIRYQFITVDHIIKSIYNVKYILRYNSIESTYQVHVIVF